MRSYTGAEHTHGVTSRYADTVLDKAQGQEAFCPVAKHIDRYCSGNSGLMCIKGVVIIYGRGGRWNSENRSHSQGDPPSMTVHYVFAPLLNCAAKSCPLLSDHTYLYVLIDYDHSSVNISLKYIMKMGSP